jgi:ABC-type Fe3+/spermidine/putrescine transport system ATPase subunit
MVKMAAYAKYKPSKISGDSTADCAGPSSGESASIASVDEPLSALDANLRRQMQSN